MKISFHKTAHIIMNDDYWARYEWFERQNRWLVKEHNTGFFDKIENIPLSMTDIEMRLLLLRCD